MQLKNQDQKVEGYYTSNQGVIKIIENYVCHDIYINKLITDFREAVLAKYEEDHFHFNLVRGICAIARRYYI